MIDKAQRVVDMVRATKQIDKANMDQICKIQDILNVNGDEAETVWKALKATGEINNLVWVIACASGFDTLEFYMKYGWMKYITEQIYDKTNEAVYKELQWAFDKQSEKDTELRETAKSLSQKEAELEARETILARREIEYRLKTERAAGKKVQVLRDRISDLEEKLAAEKRLNGRAKLVVKLMDRKTA